MNEYPHVPRGSIRVPNPRRDALLDLLVAGGANRCGKDGAAAARILAAISLPGSHIGRNAPCPCGRKRADGKTPVKHKRCCGRQQRETRDA